MLVASNPGCPGPPQESYIESMLFGLAANDTLVAIAEKHRPALERQAEEHHRHHMQLQDKLDQSPVQSYSLIEKDDLF